jgi:hypothetical protein
MNVRIAIAASSAFLLACALCGFMFGFTGLAQARGEEAPYVPHVIPVPQDHAWCYVLVNAQRGIGDIHILDCVPKLVGE